MLDGDKDETLPFAWWVSRICEEFHCLPSQALREWERLQETDQSDLLNEIMEARAYAAAKQATDDADTFEAKKRLPQTPLYELVTRIEMELAQKAIERARTAAEG